MSPSNFMIAAKLRHLIRKHTANARRFVQWVEQYIEPVFLTAASPNRVHAKRKYNRSTFEKIVLWSISGTLPYMVSVWVDPHEKPENQVRRAWATPTKKRNTATKPNENYKNLEYQQTSARGNVVLIFEILKHEYLICEKLRTHFSHRSH